VRLRVYVCEKEKIFDFLRVTATNEIRNTQMMMIAFITFKSSLVLLFEGL